MRLVVADTSPIFYLLSIGQVNLLSVLFGNVLVPDAVYKELSHPNAPVLLREWIRNLPRWLEVVAVKPVDDEMLSILGAGERDAIALALSIQAELVLIEERKRTKAALFKGLDVTGTLGVLRLASERNLIDLEDCLTKLKQTNFRYPPAILDKMIADSKGRNKQAE